MSFRGGIREIENKVIRNLEQLPLMFRMLVEEVKDDWIKYGYVPKLSECIFIAKHGLECPYFCKLPNCKKFGMFNKGSYQYCCREHFYSDKNKMKQIQEKRKLKIDYVEAHRKSTLSKTNSVDEFGLNIHQRTGEKVKKYRQSLDTNPLQKYYLNVYPFLSVEEKQQHRLKRQDTIQVRYGVGHFGGGHSSYKKVFIGGKVFVCQGYEDVAIYDLFLSGIGVDDIIVCNQRHEYAISYLHENKIKSYYPDIFIKSKNKFIEVKSIYWYNTDKDRVNNKLLSAKTQNIDVELLILEKDYVAEKRKNIELVE